MASKKINKASYEGALLIVREHQKVEAEDGERKTEKENRKLIGTYWKFKNSYGSGQDWWLYTEVVGVDGATIKKIDYQLTGRDRSEIQEQEQTSYGKVMDGWSKISKKEFIKGRGAVLKKLGLKVQ